MRQSKTPRQYLANRYFTLAGGIRKALAGNGHATDNAAAEAIIIAGTVRSEKNGKSIFFKPSVAKLQAAYDALTAQAVQA